MPRATHERTGPSPTLQGHRLDRTMLHYPGSGGPKAALDWFRDATEPLPEDVFAQGDPWIADEYGTVVLGEELFPLPVPLLDQIEALLLDLVRRASSTDQVHQAATALLDALCPLDRALPEKRAHAARQP